MLTDGKRVLRVFSDTIDDHLGFRRRHVQVHVVDRCALIVLLNFQREHRITISMFVEKPIDLMHNRTANATYYETILEHARS